MRVLITGGAGYIGSHTSRLFIEQGQDVWIYDNLVRGHRASVPSGRLIEGDLADAARIRWVLKEKRIDAVVHFAAYANVGESVEAPELYYRNNYGNTLTLLEAMREAGVGRLVFSSTCATYGIPLRTPITEEEPLKPINPYGRAKLASEWTLADYAHAHGLAYAALRYFNAAGAHASGEIGEDHDPETHLIPLVLKVALDQREAVDVYGTDYPTPDGTCIRDYVHVDDLAIAHYLALDKLKPGEGLTYNLGTGRGFSVREVIQVCSAVTGRSIPTLDRPRRPGDPPVLVAAADRARRELGWEPRYSDLAAIVETAWRWHRSHPAGYEGVRR